MIRELISYILSRAAPGARRAGLVRECVAITARHRRHADAWKPHLDRCKAHIIAAINKADPAKPILVLGAGPCLDLPLEALSAHPAGAVLVDAVLLPSTRRLIAKYPNLKFQVSDVTGLLAHGGGQMTIPELAPIETQGYGLIISANILSQLPLAFVSVPPESEDEKAIMQALQQAHVHTLKKSGVPTLIICDHKAELILENENNAYNTIDSVIFSADAFDSWPWTVAPYGELGPQKELRLTVGIWQLNWEFSSD